MQPIDDLCGVDLDEAISREIYKHEIIGKTTCYNAEGQWGVAPTTNPEQWMCHANIRPVRVYNCYCEKPSCACSPDELIKRDDETENDFTDRYNRHHFAGHDTICLTAVDVYSSNIELAFEVVETTRPLAFRLNFVDNLWIAELFSAHSVFTASVPGHINESIAAATAICRAAIRYMRKCDGTPRKASWLSGLWCLAAGHNYDLGECTRCLKRLIDR